VDTRPKSDRHFSKWWSGKKKDWEEEFNRTGIVPDGMMGRDDAYEVYLANENPKLPFWEDAKQAYGNNERWDALTPSERRTFWENTYGPGGSMRPKPGGEPDKPVPPADQPGDKPGDKPSDKPATPIKPPADKPVPPADQPGDKPGDKPSDKPATPIKPPASVPRFPVRIVSFL
jgi:hypothetical protein